MGEKPCQSSDSLPNVTNMKTGKASGKGGLKDRNYRMIGTTSGYFRTDGSKVGTMETGERLRFWATIGRALRACWAILTVVAS